MEFSRCLINDIEPALTIFQAERALAMFLRDNVFLHVEFNGPFRVP